MRLERLIGVLGVLRLGKCMMRDIERYVRRLGSEDEDEEFWKLMVDTDC